MAGKIDIKLGFSVDKSGLNEMQSLLQRISNSANSQMNPGKQIDQGLKQAAATATQLDKILDKTFNSDLGTLNVTKFNQELSKSGMTLKSVQTDLSKAGNNGVTAYNRLTQAILGTNMQLKQSNKLLDSMATTMINTVKWGITSSIFNTITNSISKAYGYVKSLDSSLNDIRIVTSKSADEMDVFAEKANNAAKALGASTLDYTNASLIYYQQGLSDQEVQARAETTVKVANVTGQAGSAVSEQLTAVWNGYKVSAEETEQYVDKLAAVAASTAADLEELSVGMSKVASAANAMGVDFDDLNAQIATIVSVTRQAPESVGTALKTIYARLGDLKVDGIDEFGVKLGEVSSQLKTMGIDILDTNGDMRDMSSVMAEVAEKWDTWTRAQQQAAAVAMAGKRQYNNLVALFENWDMYSDALETSKDSLGTLQKQQDIYMESTEAKLNKLKATWQDLYKGLISKDEIDVGIRGLTDVVDLFSKFIKSFGGGSKALLAFGSIFVNLFDKQIGKYLSQTIKQQEKIKQNLQVSQLNAQNANIPQGQLDNKATPHDLAVSEGTKEQLAYVEKIYKIKNVINDEEYNTLNNQAKELGLLAEQLSLEDSRIKKIEEKNILSKETLQGLAEGYDTAVLFGDEIDKITIKEENIEAFLNQNLYDLKAGRTEVIDITAAVKDIYHFLKLYPEIANQLTEKEYEILNTLKNQGGFSEKLNFERKELLNTISRIKQISDKQNKNIEEEVRESKELEEIYSRINKIKGRQTSIKDDFESFEKGAQKAQNLTNTITILSSTMSSLAMAWGSVNTLIDVWNDKEKSFGDKILQTFMSLGMIIPMTISSFKKLNEVLGISDLIEKKKIATTKALEAVEKIKDEASKKRILAEKAQEEAIQKRNLALMYEADLEEEGTLTTMDSIAATEAEIAAEEAEAKAKALVTEATVAETQAKEKEAAATKAASKAASLSNVYVIIAAIMAAAIIATIAWIKVQDKARENLIEENKKIIDNAKAKQEEVNANKELYDSYMNLYNQYKENKIEKEELYDATAKICNAYNIEGAALAELTGNYDSLTEAINRARQAELAEAKNQSEKRINVASENLYLKDANKDIFDKLINRFAPRHDKKHGVTFNAGLVAEEADYKFSEAVRRKFNLKETGSADVMIATENTPEAIVKQYRDLEELVEKARAGGMTEAERLESDSYQNAIKYLDNMKEYVEEIESAYEEENKITTQIYGNQLSSAKNLNDFKNKYNNYIEELKKQDLHGADAEDLAYKYISDLDNDFAKIQAGYIDLTKQLKNGEEDLKDFSDSELEYIFSGKVDLKFVQTKEDIEKEIQRSFDNMGTFETEASVSLATTLAKGNKLKKADNQALTELETDNASAMAGFDDKSVLHQLDVIDEITQHRIDKNNEYLQNYKANLEEERLLRLEELNSIYSSEEEYTKAVAELNFKNYQLANGTDEKGKKLSDEKRASLEKEVEVLQKSIDNYEKLGFAINDINNKLETGLSWEEVEDVGFSNLISDLDMIINKAESVKTAAELIGEGFTVAAEDVEKFSDTFPELLENYELMTDGSIKLNKETLQENLASLKEEVDARTEAKLLEVDQQLELKKLEQDYLKIKLENLEKYLKGEQAEQQAIDNINKAGSDYKLGLDKIIGESNAQLTKQATVNTEVEGEALLNMLNQVGQGFAEASIAHYKMLNGEAYTGKFNLNFSGTTATARQYAGNLGAKATALYKQNSANYEAIYAEAQQVQAQLNQVQGEIDALNKRRVTIEATRNKSLNALNRAAMGLAGKDKSSSGGKSKEEKEKEIDEEFDRYWEYKKAIDMLDKTMSRLEKTQSKLHGKELIESLKEENKLLAEQKANYEALLQAQERQAGELQGHLEYYGAQFKENGELANYADLTSAMLEQYMNAVQQYNSKMLSEAQYNIYEKQYEDFKKTLEKYDSLYYSEMQDTLDKLDDARRKQLENNLKAWEVEIEIKLNVTEAKRQWNDFIRDIEQDFRKIYENLSIESFYDTENFKTYNDDLNTTLQAIYDVENEITKLASTGKSDMFESMSEAQEKLKDLGNELIENGKNLYDLYESVWDNYIKKLDQAASNLKDINDQFGHISDELEYQKKLIELIYGDKAYDKMDKFYKAQQKNILTQIDSMRQQKDFWDAQFNAAYMMNKDDHNVILNDMSTWTEDMRKAYDQMIDSQNQLNNLIADGIENLTNDYLNTLADIFDKLENAVWGMNIDKLQDDWGRVTALAGEYLDDSEAFPEILSLENKILKDINNTSNLKWQQKLQAFRDSEMDFLKAKQYITQDDLDIAEARYQIMLKQIALEDAQNAKTSMKLTRNTSGNWTYQYVADEDDVADKQDDLLKGYQDIYKMADNAYGHAMELILNYQEEWKARVEEISNDEYYKNNREELNQALYELEQYYLDLIDRAYGDSELYRQEATTATGAIFQLVCEQNEENYQYLTDAQKLMVDEIKDKHLTDYEEIRSAIVDNVYPEIAAAATSAFEETNLNSQTVAAEVIHQWADDDGESVKAKINDAIDSMINNTQNFEDKMDEMAIVAGIDYYNVDESIDTTCQMIDNMGKLTADMVNQSTTNLEIMRQYVNNLALQFSDLITRVINATDEMAKYKDAVAKARDELYKLNIEKQKYDGKDFGDIGNSGGGGGGSEEKKYTSSGKEYDTKYRDPNGAAGTYAYVKDGKIVEISGYELTNTGYMPSETNLHSLDSLTYSGKAATASYTNHYSPIDYDTSSKGALSNIKDFLMGVPQINATVTGIETALVGIKMALENMKQEQENKKVMVTLNATFPNAIGSAAELSEIVQQVANMAYQQ